VKPAAEAEGPATPGTPLEPSNQVGIDRRCGRLAADAVISPDGVSGMPGGARTALDRDPLSGLASER
jgi:hypothetical protein